MTQRVVNYTYGTGNPVLPDGSIDVRDGIDNLQSMDVLMNAPEDTYNQRDGKIVRTVAGMNNEFDAQILNMGFTRIGTFASGATLTNPRQTLLWDVADGGDGQEYGWSGSFLPSGKVVPPNSTPLTTGGIAVGAWLSRFDPELRSIVAYIGTVAEVAAGKFKVGNVVEISNRAHTKFEIVSGGTPNGLDILDAGNGNTAELSAEQPIDQRAIGIVGSGWPLDEGGKLSAYADLCRQRGIPFTLHSGGSKLTIYTTSTVDLQGLDIVCDKAGGISTSVIASDGIGFSVITGIPSRPPVSAVYGNEARRKPGACIYSDTANPIVKISAGKKIQNLSVSGWGGLTGQVGIEHPIQESYSGVEINLDGVSVNGCGGDGIALRNGVEVCKFTKVTSQHNAGYGVTTAGGGGDDNQEYFSVIDCSFVGNKLDGFLLSNFKKNVQFIRCCGNSNGWYGYQSYGLTKPGDLTYMRGMLRVDGNAFSAANLIVEDCYAEDCARLVTLQVENPLWNVKITGSYLIPTLGLSNPASDVRNDILGLYTADGASTPQIYGLHMSDNFLQNGGRGVSLIGALPVGSIFDVDLDNRTTLAGYAISGFPSASIAGVKKFQNQIEYAVTPKVPNSSLGDGAGGVVTSTYVKDNLRTTGGATAAPCAVFLISANWQSTNANRSGAYLLYALKLPSGTVHSSVMAFGSIDGFAAPPSVAADGTLTVNFTQFFKGSIIRLDMNGERA